MMHRLVGYHVVKLHFMVIIHSVSLVARIILLYDHPLAITLITTVMEVCTLCLCYKSEKGERALFDSLYKSKKQLEKFKDFLTEHLPNQMAVFSKDYLTAYFINNTFKDTFQCQSQEQTKSCLKALAVETEGDLVNQELFKKVMDASKYKESLRLTHILSFLSRNTTILKELKVLNFQVYEDGKDLTCMNTETQIKNSFSDEDKTIRNKHRSNILDTTQNRLEKLLYKIAKRSPLEMTTTYMEGKPFDDSSPTSQNHIKMNNNILSNLTENKKLHIEDNSTQKLKSGSGDLKECSPETNKKRIFKAKIFLLPWDNSEAIALFLDDITQQRTCMELKVADQNKDLVIATISHELRTPLNGIIGLVDIVRKMVGDPEVLSYLDACRNSSLFLLNLINSILDLSQIKNKKLKLIYTRVTLQALLNEIKPLFQTFCSSKNLYLNFEIDPKVPKRLVTDRSRLCQIIINLLGNAFKFTSQGGVTIKIDLESTAPFKVRLSIIDTGLGIQKKDQEKLFKLFGRVDQKDKNVNSNGVGLGLTISNTLAVLLNPSEGKGIQVDSKLGKGSTFSFVIESDPVNLQDEEQASVISDEEISDMLDGINELSLRSEGAHVQKIKAENMLKKTFTGFSATTRATSPSVGKTATHRDSNFEFELKITRLNHSQELNYEKMRSDCLIVDDNPFNLMVAARIMQDRGYSVITALNGKEAIQQVVDFEKTGKTFKVALMDCQMPIMDGYQATKLLTRMMYKKEITEFPIIALTANNRDDNHEKLCRSVGMIGCISKPLQVEELEQVLKKCKRVVKKKLEGKSVLEYEAEKDMLMQ